MVKDFKEEGRYSKNFRELIDKIKGLEFKKGIPVSDKTATEIVYQRILSAGGWKEL